MKGSVYLQLDKHLSLKGEWALNLKLRKDVKRKVGDLYDIVLCFDDREIAFMTFKKAKNGSLEQGQVRRVIDCARKCAGEQGEEWIRKMERLVETQRLEIKMWILDFYKSIKF